MYTTRNLGKNIERIRAIKRIRQNELAQKVGVSCATICRYEAGIIKPSLGNFLRIREVLDVSFERLLM